MLVCGILMFASLFISSIEVQLLGERFAVTGWELLVGGFSLGPLRIDMESMSLMHIIPSSGSSVGLIIIVFSAFTIATGSKSRKATIAASATIIVSLLFQVIFLIGGSTLDLFIGDTRNMLIGFKTTVTPMYGTYLSVFSTFICGIASTYRLRECMRS